MFQKVFQVEHEQRKPDSKNFEKLPMPKFHFA